MKLFITASFLVSTSTAFAPRFGGAISRAGRQSIVQLDLAKIGIFFGTSTGSTESVADMIKEELGDDADGPFDVETLEGSVADNFGKYPALIVGTPTWNTGAEVERSGTGWDEIYYSTMQELDLQGKKVGVFGLGDQESYGENYADATGELHDVFESLGCQMMGYTSQEGYEHEDSKAIRGDKFCGLLCDMVNQEELSEERVQNWIAQLRAEGFLEGGSVSAAAPAETVVDVEPVVLETFSALEENSEILDKTIESHANTGFTPYHNDKTRSTMWVSPDGRSCYYTTEPAVSSVGVSP
jgi:flavodoxin I